MKFYCGCRENVVRYVEDQLRNFDSDWPLTMTITLEKSGDYSVLSVIGSSLEDTDQEQVAKFFSETQVNT